MKIKPSRILIDKYILNFIRPIDAPYLKYIFKIS